MTTPYSVLDLSPIPEGATAAQALVNTRELAQAPSPVVTVAIGWPNTTT